MAVPASTILNKSAESTPPISAVLKRRVGDVYKHEPLFNEKKQRTEHAQSVDDARALNHDVLERGDVQCARLVHYRAPKDKEPDKRHPCRFGYRNINVCSGGVAPFKYLSPMMMGPVHMLATDKDGHMHMERALNIENAWQFSKVWSADVEPFGDPNGTIKPEWFEFRDSGWADAKAHRWPRGKAAALATATATAANPNPNRPLFVLFEGRRMSYEDARKVMYIPWYAELVRKTAAYRELEALVAGGTNVQIIGYDGRDFKSERLSIADCLADATKPFGHELILAAMLRGESPWLAPAQ